MARPSGPGPSWPGDGEAPHRHPLASPRPLIAEIFSVLRRLTRRTSVLDEPQEPGEAPLAMAGVPRLPDPIPCPPGPGAVHRWNTSLWEWPPPVGLIPARARRHPGGG